MSIKYCSATEYESLPLDAARDGKGARLRKAGIRTLQVANLVALYGTAGIVGSEELANELESDYAREKTYGKLRGDIKKFESRFDSGSDATKCYKPVGRQLIKSTSRDIAIPIMIAGFEGKGSELGELDPKTKKYSWERIAGVRDHEISVEAARRVWRLGAYMRKYDARFSGVINAARELIGLKDADRVKELQVTIKQSLQAYLDLPEAMREDITEIVESPGTAMLPRMPTEFLMKPVLPHMLQV